MKATPRVFKRLACLLALMACLFPTFLEGRDERFLIELYGGTSSLSAKDLNLFSEAEQQYNDIYFIQRLRWMPGYFTNDFPKIKWILPVGLRGKYRLSSAFSLSLGWEGFTSAREESIEGTFSYTYNNGLTESHTRAYDPYRLKLSGYTLLGGIHYRLPVGTATNLELGAAAGYASARFEFSSTWSQAIAYPYPGFPISSLDTGILEGDGKGDGFAARAMLQLDHSFSRRFGIFLETAYTYCRLSSLEGSGREVRSGIPGEKTWQGTWAIKKEEITVPWGSATVLVPTNYWDGWITAQKERDFTLDLSRIHFVLGIQIKF
jgi:hypothetical protein